MHENITSNSLGELIFFVFSDFTCFNIDMTKFLNKYVYNYSVIVRYVLFSCLRENSGRILVSKVRNLRLCTTEFCHFEYYHIVPTSCDII